MREKVLQEVPHRHVAFSIPKMFRIFFLYDRKLLTDLCRCAWQAARQYFEISLSKSSMPAGVLSIQTAGDMLNWNPHIHGLIAAGGFQADGSFQPAPLLAENVLRELFEANVFRLLVARQLIGAERIRKIRSWKHSGFHVYAGPSIAHKEDAIRVGLYIIRSSASSSRLQLRQDGLLAYLAKGSLSDAYADPLFEPNGRIFDYLEWIARLTSHIPEKGSQLVHYYGAYSNAHRGKLAKRSAQSADGSPLQKTQESQSEWIRSRRASWAALIRLVYESDPLLCPQCHHPMRIISFIKDGKVMTWPYQLRRRPFACLLGRLNYKMDFQG